MGNHNGSTIRINLDRPDLFYFSDETISGTVELNIAEGKIEVDDIYVVLTGEIGCIITEIIETGNGHSSTEIQQRHIPFYSVKTVFAQPEVGQKEMVFSQGKYSWPFHISLTDYLPPSINQPHVFPHVRYSLQVIIDKPWYKPNKTETDYLTIYPRVSLPQNPEYSLEVTFENHNRKHIALKGTLNKSEYVPGEEIHMTLEIENPQKVSIHSIEFSMLQSSCIGQNLREIPIFQKTLPNIVNVKDEQINETFSITIPSEPTPPSYRFRGGIVDPVYVNIGYMIQLKVKVHGAFTNFDVDIPITLGTQPTANLNQQKNVEYS
jgi:hypothetical protein